MLFKFLIGFFIVAGVILTAWLVVDYLRNKEKDYPGKKYAIAYVIGFIVNFFDVLGIGSFAPTMALYRICKMDVPDRKLGPTMNVGVGTVVMLEAILFLSSVKVDLLTFACIEVAAVVGAFLGSRLIKVVNVRTIRLIMGIGLMLAAVLMLLNKASIIPTDGTLTGLRGWKLILITCTGVVMGGATVFGVGSYAPTLALVYILGMNPICAFPIMTTLGSLASGTAMLNALKDGDYVRKPAFATMVAGFAGVIVAYALVRSMPLTVLTWVVIVAVIYAGVSLLTSAVRKGATEE